MASLAPLRDITAPKASTANAKNDSVKSSGYGGLGVGIIKKKKSVTKTGQQPPKTVLNPSAIVDAKTLKEREIARKKQQVAELRAKRAQEKVRACGSAAGLSCGRRHD